MPSRNSSRATTSRCVRTWAGPALNSAAFGSAVTNEPRPWKVSTSPAACRPGDGLPDDGAADAEVGDQQGLAGQPVAGPEVAGQDPLLQPFDQLMGQSASRGARIRRTRDHSVPKSIESVVQARACPLKVNPTPGRSGTRIRPRRSEPLAKQRVEPLEVFHPRLSRVRRGQVHVDLHREVRRESEPVWSARVASLQERGDAADPRRVRLQDVGRAGSISRTCSATLDSISPEAIGVSSASASAAWPSAS